LGEALRLSRPLNRPGTAVFAIAQPFHDATMIADETFPQAPLQHISPRSGNSGAKEAWGRMWAFLETSFLFLPLQGPEFRSPCRLDDLPVRHLQTGVLGKPRKNRHSIGDEILVYCSADLVLIVDSPASNL